MGTQYFDHSPSQFATILLGTGEAYAMQTIGLNFNTQPPNIIGTR